MNNLLETLLTLRVSLFFETLTRKENTCPGIERQLAGIGNITSDEVLAISQKLCNVLDSLGPKIQWLHSQVTADTISCVYIASNEERIRSHAKLGGFAANRISEVKLVIDPTSAEV